MQTNMNTTKLQKPNKQGIQEYKKDKGNKPVKHDKRNNWKEA